MGYLLLVRFNVLVLLVHSIHYDSYLIVGEVYFHQTHTLLQAVGMETYIYLL